MSEGSISYLALERAREGTAAVVHVREIIKGLTALGWRVRLFSTADPKRAPVTIWRLVDLVLAYVRFAFSPPADIVYVRAHPLAWLLLRFSRSRHRPVIHEINGPMEDIYVAHPFLRPLRRLLDAMQRAQYRRAAALIVVTPDLERWLRGLLGPRPVRIEVISNGANIDLFKPGLERPTAMQLPQTYAVFFGGLTRWHGVECMLQAVECAEWPERVSLVIAGEGVESEAVYAAAKRNPKVLPLGLVAYSDLGAVVANALVGLVPISDPSGRSQTGLAPLKLFETLACGIPAIVTDLKGQAEFVRENGCGLVVADGDSRALAASVTQLSKDPQRARDMGQRGTQVVRAEHSWHQRAVETHQLVASVLKQEATSR